MDDVVVIVTGAGAPGIMGTIYSLKKNYDKRSIKIITTDIKDNMDMLSRNPSDISGMYNLFFDARVSDENIFIGYDREKIASDLKNRDFAFALLSGYDVTNLKESPEWESITKIYDSILVDEEKQVFLLVR